MADIFSLTIEGAHRLFGYGFMIRRQTPSGHRSWARWRAYARAFAWMFSAKDSMEYHSGDGRSSAIQTRLPLESKHDTGISLEGEDGASLHLSACTKMLRELGVPFDQIAYDELGNLERQDSNLRLPPREGGVETADYIF
jgi:hypothetical protein